MFVCLFVSCLVFKKLILYLYYADTDTKILEVNLFANANKLTSRIFVYKRSPSSTLPLVIPEIHMNCIIPVVVA